MIEGKEDKVFAKVGKVTDGILAKLMTMSKREKPAFVEPVKPIDRLFNFDNMTDEEIQNFTFEHGQEAYMQEMFEADKIRRRLGGPDATR